MCYNFIVVNKFVVMEDQVLILAMKMYKDYGDSADNKNYQGLPMPTWNELPDNVRKHWCYVAEKNGNF